MNMNGRIVTALLLAGGMMAAAMAAPASAAAIPNLVIDTVNNSALTTLKGELSPLIKTLPDLGQVPDNDTVGPLLIALRHSDQQERDVQALIERQTDPASPDFHKWLTPNEYGERFGAAEGDLAAVIEWLKARGLQVDVVGNGRNTIQFSGKARNVSAAFHTELHYFKVENERHYAMLRDPQLPAALTAVVAGITGLNGLPPEAGRPPRIEIAAQQQSDLTAVPPPGCPNCLPSNMIGPNDFAKIYNVQALWNAGITGTGVTIGIVTHSDVNLADIADFRAAFGLTAKVPTVVQAPGYPDPGITSGEAEALLDTELATGIAKNANILIDVSQSISIAANDIIQNNRAAILNYSFGGCEIGQGAAGNAVVNTMWQQAVVQGITVTSSSGDSGSAGCTDANGGKYADLGTNVNSNSTTPYDVSVGGTDFSDYGTSLGSNGASDFSTYWNASNTAGTLESAKSYIPEIPWNSSCASTFILAAYGKTYGYTTAEALCNDQSTDGLAAFRELSGGGGGPSNCTSVGTAGNPATCSGGYAKPSWQTGVLGIPADGKRDTPDVSLFGAFSPLSNSAYVLCQRDSGYQHGAACSPSTGVASNAAGTSASAPAFAGIMALVDQKQITAASPDGRQGQADVVLYKLAAREYGSGTAPNNTNLANCNSSNASAVANGGACVFYDITLGNNAQPCETGTVNCITNVAGDAFGILGVGGKLAYAATPGYDMATGLGSVNAYNLAINWSSVAAPAALSLSPATVSFGSQNLNTSSVAHVLTLTNTGGIQAEIKSITSTGSAFTQTNTCTGYLPGGASCAISVVFKPTVAGSVPGSVAVVSTAPTVAASFNGTGAAPLPTLNMTTNESTIYLVSAGLLGVNTTTNPTNFTLNWATTNATSCTATSNLATPNSFSGTQATSGALKVSAQASSLAFPLTLSMSLSCTGPGGTASQTVTVQEKALQTL